MPNLCSPIRLSTHQWEIEKFSINSYDVFHFIEFWTNSYDYSWMAMIMIVQGPCSLTIKIIFLLKEKIKSLQILI